ncbi:hypothetical protein [Janthinobacterium agaricidamnosum]|uniref:Lipoprotein n=1 Tax=Janthinobacterium agaricidamnosum NBRC 102515 = DSM 9628 TaxID=1349767 RepID=W0V1F3_9BURK|nr:hypothetical protein [Janthinobacterium agaricidamnosum]CDG81706.1 putative uncharacterized protein [Janthinobacterium agaricidamnosum NBRC 102515 = DSM 9628]
MKASKKVMALLAAGLMVVSLAACQKKDDVTDKGPAETAGQKIDETAAKANQEIKDAADKASTELHNTAQETGAKIDQAGEDASKKLNDAAEKVGAKVEAAGQKIQDDAAARKQQ